MKSSFLFIFFTSVFYLAAAQIKVPDEETMNSFLQSKTYVVLEENPNSVWNPIIDSCMKAIWTVTPYQILAANAFEPKMKDGKASFLYISLAHFMKNGPYNFMVINLSMGDASGNINNLHDVCLLPIAYDDADPESFDFKLPYFIRFIHGFVLANKSNSGKDLKEIVKENVSKLKETTVYFLGEDLESAVNTDAEIQNVYPYRIKIVDREALSEVINSKQPNTAFFHKVGPDEYSVEGNDCLKFIFSIDSCMPLYFDFHKISASQPNAFLKEDFIKLAK